MAWLVAHPDETVKFLTGRIREEPVPTAEKVADWIRQLDAAAFQERENAENRLSWVAGTYANRHGEVLKHEARENPSAEVRKRMGKVLTAWDSFVPSTEDIRAARAVEVLERINTPAARTVLMSCAKGPADSRLARDAADSLDRTK